MTRIFLFIAAFTLVFMAATGILGLSLDLHSRLDDPTTAGWARIHRLSGIAAGIFIVFAHCIVVTYFVGTSRWCKEVAETYHLDAQYVARSAQLKRKTFPWAVFGMLTAVCVVALGGAADPATLREGTAHWVIPHLIGALVGLAVIAFAFYREFGTIIANHALINEIVAKVKSIREERGLPV